MSEKNLLPSGLPRIESLEMRDIVKRFPAFWPMITSILMSKQAKFMRCWAKMAPAKAR